MKYYSQTRKDRSGAQIHDMLFAKNYCLSKKHQYLGCPIKRKETQLLVNYLGIVKGNQSKKDFY